MRSISQWRTASTVAACSSQAPPLTSRHCHRGPACRGRAPRHQPAFGSVCGAVLAQVHRGTAPPPPSRGVIGGARRCSGSSGHTCLNLGTYWSSPEAKTGYRAEGQSRTSCTYTPCRAWVSGDHSQGPSPVLYVGCRVQGHSHQEQQLEQGKRGAWGPLGLGP